ncbi:putative gpi anchored serine-threonine rich protein [Botrytis fragariae]|uniref:Putative gpi anchored serine-threonine rich protein n=1 Tax=Botrytis fragariae TaxID=1964551 RepID=A0A8H6ENC9_9HELO|nr:putative gpi anchored serine-threonine rich protein [Botrytis fragariae]KAF5878504.1 putative gpi anchored serine-threonine rich protein [Botrytis fragariae]
MRYQFVSAAILASISSVFAQTAGFDAISVPTNGQVVSVGDVLDITWAPNSVSGTVTIKLLEGASPATLNYDPVVVATSVNNLDGSYKWTVPASVGSFATYGIAIFLDSDVNTFQWSFPFVINAAASSSSSVIVSTTASSSVVASTSAVTSVVASATTEPHAALSSSTSSVFSSISGIPGGCNPAHPGSCPSSYFSTVTTATATPAPVPTAAPATNGTASNGTWTAPSGSNVTLSSSASATKTGSGVVTATGAASAKVATGSFALLGGLFAAFML